MFGKRNVAVCLAKEILAKIECRMGVCVFCCWFGACAMFNINMCILNPFLFWINLLFKLVVLQISMQKASVGWVFGLCVRSCVCQFYVELLCFCMFWKRNAVVCLAEEILAKIECRMGVWLMSCWQVDQCMSTKRTLLQTKLRSYIVAAEGIEDHKSSACRQFQNLKDFGQHLPFGHTVVHVDYKQSPTIPRGPDEPGSWWFAIASRSVTLFGAHILAHSATSTEEEPCIVLFCTMKFG